MRHNRSEPRQRMFRGSEFGRLMTMLMMLVILFMLIREARNPMSWRWLLDRRSNQDATNIAEDSTGAPSPQKRPGSNSAAAEAVAASPSGNPTTAAEKSTQPAGDKPTAEKSPVGSAAHQPLPSKPSDPQPPAVAVPPAAATPSPDSDMPPGVTGLTDEDSEEAGAAREEFGAMLDGGLNFKPEEMEAYRRVVRWVLNQSYQRLKSRVMYRNPTFGSLAASPEEYRGQIIELNFHVRRAIQYDTPLKFYGDDEQHLPVTLYELWGLTDESRGHPWELVVADLPKGMPVGFDVVEDVHFVGYFMRLQGYEPANAKPNSRPLIAPLLVGRITWKARVPVEMQASDWQWIVFFVGGFILIALVTSGVVFFSHKRPSVAPMNTELPRPKSAALDEWLDKTESAEHLSGNNPPPVGELNGGDVSGQNGHVRANGRLFPDHQEGGSAHDG